MLPQFYLVVQEKEKQQKAVRKKTGFKTEKELSKTQGFMQVCMAGSYNQGVCKGLKAALRGRQSAETWQAIRLKARSAAA